MKISALERLTRKTCQAVKETAAFIRTEAGKVGDSQIEEKHLNGLVSYVDRTAEEMLVERLGKLLPKATFLTEEATIETQDSDLQWIIDPLDGTTNFLHNVPQYSVSVGLKMGDDLVLGVVWHVPLNENYYAWKDGGAYCNGRPIHVSQRAPLRNALVSTGFPYYNFDRMEGWIKATRSFMAGARGMRRFGSAALDLAYVAAGRFDVFFEYGLNPWDVAGGIVLVEEAGGTVSDFKGGRDCLSGTELLACNAVVHAETLAIMRESFQV